MPRIMTYCLLLGSISAASCASPTIPDLVRQQPAHARGTITEYDPNASSLRFLLEARPDLDTGSLAARECRRVLRDSGFLFVRTGTRERIPSYPYYPFFPTSHPILEEVLPGADQIRGIFEPSGFHFLALDLVAQTIAPSWAAYADKLEANADSVLARLDRHDFENGIHAVREYAHRDPDKDVVELIDLFVFRAT